MTLASDRAVPYGGTPMTIELLMRRTGRGYPVVFLGGCPTPWDVLAPIADAIAATHESIEIALPGYATSPALPDPYSLAAAEQAIVAMLAGAGVRECALVGFSGGAYRALSLALALAASNAIAVTALFSISGLAALSPDEATGSRQFAAALRAGQDLRPLAAPRFLSAPFAAAHPGAVRAVEGWLSAAPAGVIAAELDAFANAPDLLPALAALRIPIVARVGSADAAAPEPKSEAIVKACASARLELVEGAGHALVYEDLDGTVASLRRLLEEQRTG